jgi:hypothetical protein
MDHHKEKYNFEVECDTQNYGFVIESQFSFTLILQQRKHSNKKKSMKEVTTWIFINKVLYIIHIALVICFL